VARTPHSENQRQVTEPNDGFLGYIVGVDALTPVVGVARAVQRQATGEPPPPPSSGTRTARSEREPIVPGRTRRRHTAGERPS
jgi:hypothetical protein